MKFKISWIVGALSVFSLAAFAMGRARLPISRSAPLKPYSVVNAAQGSCPAALPGLVDSGCLILPEDSRSADPRLIQIYFGFVKPFDASQSTIVVLNGGPGESVKVYSAAPQLRALSKDFNVMFYDQRGIGMSSVITESNVKAADLAFYSTPINSWDLEQLRKYVISPKYKQPSAEIIVLGHSYGGHLAYQYATDYPSSVSKLIVLNGTSTWEGFLIQSKLKLTLLGIDMVVPDSTEEERQAFLELLFKNQLVNPKDPSKLIQSRDMLAFFQQVFTFSSGQDQYLGLNKQLYLANQALIQKRADQIKQEKANQGSSAISTQLPVQKEIRFSSDSSIKSRFSSDPESDMNSIINQKIVCHEFINRQTLQAFASNSSIPSTSFKNEVVEAAQDWMGGGCPEIDPSQIHPFNVRPKLSDLKMPVLIVGGENDPLINIWTQFSDYRAMNRIQSPDMNLEQRIDFYRNYHPTQPFSLVLIHKAGHQFTEGGACLDQKISEFLTKKDFVPGFFECNGQ